MLNKGIPFTLSAEWQAFYMIIFNVCLFPPFFRLPYVLKCRYIVLSLDISQAYFYGKNFN